MRFLGCAPNDMGGRHPERVPLSWRRLAFVVVGTLVLWYLGHFALRAAWTLGAFEGAAVDSRWLDLALLPAAAALAWLVARRLDRRRTGDPP